MRVDLLEVFPSGRQSLRPGVDLAVAVPDRAMRNRVMSILSRGEAAVLTEPDSRAAVTITLTRNRPPEGGAAFAIRVRPKTGPTGAAAPLRSWFSELSDFSDSMLGGMGTWQPLALREAAPPDVVPRLADRIAAVMQRQTAETGACTVRDLRQAGLSYRQITRHADAARELIAVADLQTA